MVLANVTAYAVLEIFHNFVSMQKVLFAKNCWSKYNYKKFPISSNLDFYWTLRYMSLQFCENASGSQDKKCW